MNPLKVTFLNELIGMDQLRLEKAQKNAKTSGGSHLVEFRAEERL